jgi:Na+/melibiose symporter-like transporter
MSKKLIKIIGFIVVLFIVALVSVVVRDVVDSQYNGSQSKNIKSTLEQVVIKLNKKLPMQVDKQTTLDSASSLNNEIFYYYTAVNLKVSELNTDIVSKKLHSSLIKKYCADKKMKSFIKNNIIANYCYYDKNGSPITKIKITPAQCK